MIHTQETARVVQYEDVRRYAYQWWQVRERIRLAEGRPELESDTAQRMAVEDWESARQMLRFGD